MAKNAQDRPGDRVADLESVQALLEASDLEGAMAILKGWALPPARRNTLILLAGQLRRLNEDTVRGVVTKDAREARLADLTQRLLAFLSDVAATEEEADPRAAEPVATPAPGPKPGKPREPASGPPRIFISYSHKDRKALDEFKAMLAPAIQAGKIEVWDDTRIQPGKIWLDEIRAALDSARIALLLVSAEFLASRFIVENELPPLLDGAREHDVTIFWVLWGPCGYEHSPIEKYQAAHDTARALNLDTKARRTRRICEICDKLVDLATA